MTVIGEWSLSAIFLTHKPYIFSPLSIWGGELQSSFCGHQVQPGSTTTGEAMEAPECRISSWTWMEKSVWIYRTSLDDAHSFFVWSYTLSMLLPTQCPRTWGSAPSWETVNKNSMGCPGNTGIWKGHLQVFVIHFVGCLLAMSSCRWKPARMNIWEFTSSGAEGKCRVDPSLWPGFQELNGWQERGGLHIWSMTDSHQQKTDIMIPRCGILSVVSVTETPTRHSFFMAKHVKMLCCFQQENAF